MDSMFFQRPAPLVARDLIGWDLTVRGCGGMVIETEAYTPDDPASHSFRGLTFRNRSMFGPAGHAYIYLSYGLHLCLNVVCLPAHAVLFRALLPRCRIATMMQRRSNRAEVVLCAGPGRIGQALGLSAADDGKEFDGHAFALSPSKLVDPADIAFGPHIGLSRGLDTA